VKARRSAAGAVTIMTRMVVLDGFTVNPGDNPWDDLARLGELKVYERTPPGEVVERCRDAEIVLTNKTALRGDALEQLTRLRFIAELATGYDNLDIAVAGRLGIPVANVPEYGTDSVAQHTMALLLELCNRVAMHDDAVKKGEWGTSPDFSFWKAPLTELAGRKFGIVGFGRIGRRVGELAQAFGMSLLAYTPHPISTMLPVEWRSVRELCAEADVVSLHCPSTKTNEGFVDAGLLSLMKRDALLINTARGKLVNEVDLARALNEGWIAGAALDVVSREPIASDNPLLSARNCLITPHIAWASLAARRRLTSTTVKNVEAFLKGEPINIVNSRYLDRERDVPR
jgi:glycerate dehydrogenase